MFLNFFKKSSIIFIFFCLGVNFVQAVFVLPRVQDGCTKMVLNRFQNLISELEQMYLIQREDIDESLVLNLIYNQIKAIMKDRILIDSCHRDVFLTIGRVLEMISDASDADDKELGVVRHLANKYLPQVNDEHLTTSMKKNFQELILVVQKTRSVAWNYCVNLGNKYSCFATLNCQRAFSLLVEKAFDQIIIERIHKHFEYLLSLHVHFGMDWGFLAVSEAFPLS